MKWLKNLKISVKLIAGFLIIAAIAALIGVVGLVNIKNINAADTKLYKENALGLQYSGTASTNFQRLRYNTIKLTILESSTELEAATKTLIQCRLDVDKSLEDYKNCISTPQQEVLFQEIGTEWSNFSAYLDEIVEMANENNYKEIQNIILVKAQDIGDSIRTNLEELANLDAQQAKERSEGNDALAYTSTRVMLLVIIIGTGVSIALGFILSYIISNPIKQMVKVADQLALGDVNATITIHTKDELGRLAESFRNMIDNIRSQALTAERIADGDLTIEVAVRSEEDLLGKKLLQMVHNNNEVLTNISLAAEQVAVGSKQVSNSSISLSQGATEQASSVEELTAALEEIASQTELNAKNASQANELADVAKQNAIQGNDQMKEMLKAMEEISESSANISKIIKVIDDIAFQTNILALNAAVEAARAGQHGKGFAVVAEEVRNLAARSANASKETTDMIEGSIKKAESGTKIAKDTAEALKRIVEGVEKTSTLVNDIAVASSEQSLGISQVNLGLMQVSQVVQTNSATSEESAAASEELSNQAELLKEEVGKFKIKQMKKSYSQREDISPEVLRMLEASSNKNKLSHQGNVDQINGEINSKVKIALNDNEFGKY